jgi:fermentation-respiration switch protein FrsA (DUF1100 family)
VVANLCPHSGFDEAVAKAREPRELFIVPGATHIDPCDLSFS